MSEGARIVSPPHSALLYTDDMQLWYLNSGRRCAWVMRLQVDCVSCSTKVSSICLRRYGCIQRSVLLWTALVDWWDTKSVKLQKNYTYLPTPHSWVLLEKLTGSLLVKKFPGFYETRRFITAFTSARHLSLTWASSIQSISPHPTSWRSSHLRLGLPSGLFLSGFPTKTLYIPLLSPISSTETLYRVSQKECARLREGVPYVKVYRYNPKHLCPNLNGYVDNGERSLKVWQLLHTYWLPNTY